MKNAKEIYYERAVRYFELEQYDQAVEDWIQAYELGYNHKQILENLYQCFILPNDNEFRENFKLNNQGYTKLFYDECVLDFIPVSDVKFYIFNREEQQFQGTFYLEETVLQGEKLEFDSILYTNTWDVREILRDMEKQGCGMVYLMLEKLEPKFFSFLKLPRFRELYMGKFVLFHDLSSMKAFFLAHEKFYFPRRVVTSDTLKYANMLRNIRKEKVSNQQSEKGRNVLFLKGISQYGALRRMIDDLAAAFRREGYNTLVFDGGHQFSAQQLSTASGKYEFDAVITLNAMFIENDLIRRLGKKYVTIMGDHPLWHHERLQAADKDTIVWDGDQNDVDYIRKYYQNVGNVQYFNSGSATFLKEEVAYSNRMFDLVFTGSYNKPEKIYKQICGRYSGKILMLVKDFINKLVTSPNKTYEGALKETLIDYGQENIDDEEFCELAAEFGLVNHYVRSYFRDRIIREIVENGIKIHVSGNGWEDFESEFSDNIVIESNDWYTAKKMIANAKISLNIMPWFKSGFHDRAITSLLSGAVLLTDSSEYIEEYYDDMQNIAIFYLDKLEELPRKIRFLLCHENIAETIATNGRKIAEQRYTWDDYAKKMITSLKKELNDQSEFTEMGHVLPLVEEEDEKQAVATDVLTELKEIEELLDAIQSSTMFGKKDYEYCVSRIKEQTRRLVSEFPNVEVGNYVWNAITKLIGDIASTGEISSNLPELIRMQISYLARAIMWNQLE